MTIKTIAIQGIKGAFHEEAAKNVFGNEINIEIEGNKYYGNNDKKIGDIYEYLEDGDVGDVVGHYVNGVPIII